MSVVAETLGPPNPWFSVAWISKHTADLGLALREHVVITIGAMALAAAITIPLALLARRFGRLEAPILAGLGVLYTIPALALIGALWPIFGLSMTTVMVALAGYALLVLVRNLLVGLAEVPVEVIDAARGMGLSPRRLFWRIELPLAIPAAFAGLRIAAVSTIGLLTIGSFVGYGGLGNLMKEGLERSTGRAEVVTASLLCVALALLAEGALLGLQRVLTPWSRHEAEQPR